MLYGWRTENTVYLGAADTIGELVEAHQSGAAFELVAIGDLFGGGEYAGFLIVPAILDLGTEADAVAFIETTSITIETPTQIRDRQIKLVATMKPLDRTIARSPTIKETLGLAGDPQMPPKMTFKTVNGRAVPDESDTLANQARSADIRRAEEEVRRLGYIKTGDYVVFSTSEADLYGDGQIETIVHFVLKRRVFEANDRAVPCPSEHLSELPSSFVALDLGIYHCRETPIEAATALLNTLHYHHDQSIRDTFLPTAEPRQRGKELSSKDGSEFHRIDVENASLEALERFWTNEDWTYADSASGCGEIEPNSVWYAFKRPGAAARFRDRIQRHGFVVSSVVLVNALNERSGVVSPTAVSACEPRPWNDKATALLGMSADQLEDNRLDYAAKEFLYARVANGVPPNECRIVIAPTSVFKETNSLFANSLDLDHLLPSYLKEVSAGLYSTTRADWPTLDHEMKTRGFQKSMNFNIFANKQ